MKHLKQLSVAITRRYNHFMPISHIIIGQIDNHTLSSPEIAARYDKQNPHVKHRLIISNLTAVCDLYMPV